MFIVAPHQGLGDPVTTQSEEYVSTSYIEIKSHTGPGYQPLVDHNGWRVAHLNYLDGLHPDRNHSMERHLETDEVFVLVAGQGVLYIGEGEAKIECLNAYPMQTGVIYNVKRRAWHTVVLSREGRLVIVENRDTSPLNTEYGQLDGALCAELAASARQAIPGGWK